MKQYRLQILSKNEKSLKKFIDFFLKYSGIKYDILKRSSSKQKQRKVFTVLKSPHVNKKAQEQFEYRVFSEQLLIKTHYMNRNLIFLKKIMSRLFHDISIKVEIISNPTSVKKLPLLLLYPDNFQLDNKRFLSQNVSRRERKKISVNKALDRNNLSNLAMFLKTLDTFGEMVVTYPVK